MKKLLKYYSIYWIFTTALATLWMVMDPTSYFEYCKSKSRHVADCYLIGEQMGEQITRKIVG